MQKKKKKCWSYENYKNGIYQILPSNVVPLNVLGIQQFN